MAVKSPARADVAAAPPHALEIDALLPQTQCQRCGYPDCLSYARAVAGGEAGINRCPPGGLETLAELADLTGQPVRELDPQCGAPEPRRVARIEESWCIGCTRCIEACPVDAIIGARRRMHVVIRGLCTGCELCVAPCPVECIELLPDGLGPRTPGQWLEQRAAGSRARYRTRAVRLERTARARTIERERGGDTVLHGAPSPGERRAAIADAVARVRARTRTRS